MPEWLSHNMQQKVEHWCRDIVSGCGDGNDVFEELYGHIEDGMLAYMNGEMAVSEDDAFMLVREHFGNPATVRTNLLDAHPATKPGFPLGRFLMQSAAAILVSSVIAAPVMALIVVVLMHMFTGPDIPIVFDLDSFPVTLVVSFSMIVAILTVLPFIYVLYMRLREPRCRIKTLGTLLKPVLTVTLIFLAVMTVFTLFVHSRLTLYGWKNMPLDVINFLHIRIIELISGFLRQSVAIGFFAALPWTLNRLRRDGFIGLSGMVMIRSWLIILAVILGAVLTPPDPLSMIILTFFMIFTFEIARAFSWACEHWRFIPMQ